MHTLTALHDAAPVTGAAQRSVLQHASPPAEGRVAGRCAHCGEADPCPCLVAAIHYLRAAAGVSR
jgi:hypothetical protein